MLHRTEQLWPVRGPLAPKGRRTLEIRGQDHGLDSLPALLKCSSSRETERGGPEVSSGLPKGQAA